MAVVFLLLAFVLTSGSRLAAQAPTSPSGQSEAKKPHIVFVTGDHEYSGEQTLPLLARALEKHFGLRCTVLKSFPDQNAETNLPGLEQLDHADLAVFYLRWRRLPKEQVVHIERYLKSGKPVVGFRTSTHAFNYPAGDDLAKWNAWATEVFGGPPGWGKDGHTHYGHHSSTDVRIPPEAVNDPILRGVAKEFHVRSWLYHVRPKYPPADAKVLLVGKSVNPDKPATENPVAWTWTNPWGGRVFFTTLGHPEDFGVEAFQRLIVNGLYWALGRPVPENWPGKLPINVPYRGMVKSEKK
jgi:type 1 glutamine amidotransferase